MHVHEGVLGPLRSRTGEQPGGPRLLWAVAGTTPSCVERGEHAAVMVTHLAHVGGDRRRLAPPAVSSAPDDDVTLCVRRAARQTDLARPRAEPRDASSSVRAGG